MEVSIGAAAFIKKLKLKKMKTKTIVALLATAIMGAGAYFYFAKINIEPPIPKQSTQRIIGNWQIDSFYTNKDSNGVVLFAFLFKDSTSFKFNADSTLQIISPSEATTQHYVLNNDSLIINQSDGLDTFQVKFETDNQLSVVAKDSSVLILKRIDK